jgi:hypothetical protein
MRARGLHLFLVWAGILATLLAGCKSFFAPRGVPEDPLLMNQQPIESKGQVTPTPPRVRREILPPGEDVVGPTPPRAFSATPVSESAR